ncbi:MAG: hypothetical protein PHF10_04545 [Patescibacteria group bacterium]|nr:hypothetical protein [Patescibacteria group bacterium]MDD5534990.1 hypothetical protein [Patescibacteria group bacterium]
MKEKIQSFRIVGAGINEEYDNVKILEITADANGKPIIIIFKDKNVNVDGSHVEKSTAYIAVCHTVIFKDVEIDEDWQKK